MPASWCGQLNEGANKLTRRDFLWQKFLLRECLCVGKVSITYRGHFYLTFVLWSVTGYLVILKWFCMSLFGHLSFWAPTHFPEIIHPKTLQAYDQNLWKTTAKMVHFDRLQISKPQLSEKLNFDGDVLQGFFPQTWLVNIFCGYFCLIAQCT